MNEVFKNAEPKIQVSAKEPTVLANPDKRISKSEIMPPVAKTEHNPQINPDKRISKSEIMPPVAKTEQSPRINPDKRISKSEIMPPVAKTEQNPRINPDKRISTSEVMPPFSKSEHNPQINPDKGMSKSEIMPPFSKPEQTSLIDHDKKISQNETESNLTDLSDSSENKEKTDQSEQNEAQTDNQNKDSDENTEQRTDDAENSPIRIKCRNENLEGQEHPDTGVPFERKQVEVDGKKYEVVVPKFDSMFDAQLPEDMYKASDREQFNECNAQLKNEIATNPDLREKFDDEQLEQIENGDTPDGYTWHHDAEAGKMQLVDTETHQKTGHTGGRSIWGGGAESR